MTIKSIVLRTRAVQEVEAAMAWYRTEGAYQAAIDFIEALEFTFGRIARQPAMGSPRIGHEVDLPGLRSMTLRRFPYCVFYVELADRVDVWRVLHGKRDLPGWLQQEE